MQVFVSAKDNITVLEGETAIQYPNIESAQHIDQHGVNFLLYCKEPNQKQKMISYTVLRCIMLLT